MKIIIHYPETEEDIVILKNKIAEIYSDSVIKYIKKMTCPTEQKLKLLDDIVRKMDDIV